MTSRRILIMKIGTAAILALASLAPAQAQTITMTGLVINSCVLTITTPGVLSTATGGTTISTEETGGTAATLSVVATGANPTITFSSPAITGPSSSGTTTEFKYASSGGANRAYASTGYVYSMSQLLDIITINGRGTNANGFAAGTYQMSATATCAQ